MGSSNSKLQDNKVDIEDVYKARIDKLEMENKFLTREIEIIQQTTEVRDRNLAAYKQQREDTEKLLYTLLKNQETQLKVKLQ